MTDETDVMRSGTILERFNYNPDPGTWKRAFRLLGLFPPVQDSQSGGGENEPEEQESEPDEQDQQQDQQPESEPEDVGLGTESDDGEPIPDEDEGPAPDPEPTPSEEDNLDFDPEGETGEDWIPEDWFKELIPDPNNPPENVSEEGYKALPVWSPPPLPKPDVSHREFASWHEFVTCAMDDTLYDWHRSNTRNSHKTENSSEPWHGTNTWDEAVRMALFTGWPDGLKLLSESMTLINPRPKYHKSIELSVAGMFPMVPNYCAGDPECMVIDPGAENRHTKPIIRIDYNNWVTYDVDPKDMMLRGAAVLSLADSLEKRGYSTELRVVGNSTGDWGKGKVFRYSIVFKQAGETLDLDRAAFAMAHPACMRRLAFAILEQHGEVENQFRSGYGSPRYEPNDPTSGEPGGAIYVPGSRGYETPDIARAAVETAAENLLTNIRESEELEGSVGK